MYSSSKISYLSPHILNSDSVADGETSNIFLTLLFVTCSLGRRRRSGASNDDEKLSDNNLKKRYEEIATRRVKLAILVQKIAEKYSIVVTNEEITSGLLEYASQYPGQEKKIFEFFKKNPTQMESIKAPIFENKVLDNVFSNTTKENQAITINEFQKLQEKTFSYKN